MSRSTGLKVYRLGFALLPIIAIGATLADLAGRGVLNPVNFFSFFTIQGNVIGVVAFVLAGTARQRSVVLDLVRGASVVYLTVTFVVYALLLSGTDVDMPLAWVDFILHKVFPIVVFADWVIDPPVRRVTVRQAVSWLVYPLAWVGYTLVRGPLANWYPYPFLDPANGGYGRVAAYVVGIVIFGIVVIAIVTAVGNWLGGRRAQREMSAAAGR